MKIITVNEHPEFKDQAIAYFQSKWASEATMMVYEDCITHAILTDSSLPRWYLLLDEEKIVGCAGLITNDFISRMDLWPWICALYIDESYRGQAQAKELLEHAKKEAREAGFANVYLCTDHIGFYEKYDFTYIGDGYHPWGDHSRIYKSTTSK